MEHPKVAAAIAKFGLQVSAVFVPQSQSRNRVDPVTGKSAWSDKTGESARCLNWRVKVIANGRHVMNTDYSQGVGHIPGWSQARPRSVDDQTRREELLAACETGEYRSPNGSRFEAKKALSAPTAADVLYGLAMDASVIDCRSFDEWASDCGYGTDSRKAEEAYRACLATALQLRQGLGDAGLAELREAFQDY